MGHHFRRGALAGLLLWLSLLALIFTLAPSESYQRTEGMEQQCFLSVFTLILVTNSSRFIPLALRENGAAMFQSGVLGAVLVVQVISMAGCLMLGVAPTPIVTDPFTGMRCPLVLWANFVALSFLMSFLTENIDATVKNMNSKLTNNSNHFQSTQSIRNSNDDQDTQQSPVQVSWFLATAVASSCSAGFVFPFCPNFTTWMITMVISWILFTALYYRLYVVAMRFLEVRLHRKATQMTLAATTSSTNSNYHAAKKQTTIFSPQEDDCYELYRLSFIAHLVCSITWTILAVGFCIFAVLQPLAPPESILANPSLAVAFFCTFEVLSKILFLSTLVEAYESVFDETTRTIRHQRFEFEKQLIEQVTTRKKDASAVRFSRHEVKNGILSAVGAVEQLEEIIMSRKDAVGPATICNSLQDLQGALHDVLDRVADDAMSREIVHGEYAPRYENLNIPAALSPIRRGALQRFTLHKTPHNFPLIRMDRALLRCIYRNVLSNACRYGKADGIVETTIRFIEKDRRFELQVTNLPGPGHDQLVQLSENEVGEIFQQGTRLEINRPNLHNANLRSDASNGDGAWIVQNCARVVDGNCTLQFTPKQTIFTFSCSVSGYFFEHSTARSSSSSADSNRGRERSNSPTAKNSPRQQELQKPKEFQVPPGTWGIAIDDSTVQRKLLKVYFKMVGVKESRRIILGKDAEEIFGFCETVEKIVQENPTRKILIVADENLDVVEGGAQIGTVSGSESVQKILNKLDPSLADRLLCLVRSANDSDADLSLYKLRAHGYLLKQPMKRDDVTKTLQQWWEARFPPGDESKEEEKAVYESSDSDGENSSRPDSGGGRRDSMSVDSQEEDMCVPSEDDIRNAMAMIDSLFDMAIQSRSSKPVFWPALQDRLFALKGDLKSLDLNTEDPEERLENLIKNNEWPDHSLREWLDLRKQIDAVFEAEG